MEEENNKIVFSEEEKERYKKILKEKLPELKKIEGFPLGNDEDILSLSDPPYYTACPNPFINEFIKKWEWEKHCFHHEAGLKDTEGNIITEESFDIKKCPSCIDIDSNYHREPYASDVSEGKNHPIYNAHSYHTKVPHKAIMRYILHYTEPGDIVFDGFCGTGMTGVAAQLCGDKKAVEELGYKVEEDGTILAQQEEEDRKQAWKKVSKLGVRKAILNDVSPAATFIAYNYNTPVNVREFEKEAKKILIEVKNECAWMYETQHVINGELQKDSNGKIVMGEINYTVWSDVFICFECGGEIVFWDVAVDKVEGEVKEEFNCSHCGVVLTKKKAKRAWESTYDKYISDIVKQAKQVPVLINYSARKKNFNKNPDEFDFKLINKINDMDIPYWLPTDRMPDGYNTEQPKNSHGVTHVHHFYTKRNLLVLSLLFDKKSNFLLSTMINRSSKRVMTVMSNYFAQLKGKTRGGWAGKPLMGTLYIPSINTEVSPLEQMKSRINSIINLQNFKLNYKEFSKIIFCNSTTNLSLLSNSLDYIFTDPPFGGNIMYSELNFLWEAWLKVFTNNKSEAIINKVQYKKLQDYQNLMTECFKEYYRVLKPGRWMTVEFSNTSSSIWNSIQEALQRAGFVVANVSALDKKQGSFKAVTTTTAVKQDLVISTYKPSEKFTSEGLSQQPEETVWNFVDMHLKMLPVFIGRKGVPEIIIERTPRILFDRMVAYFVQNGYPVPLSSGEFQQNILEKYPERDGMVFLSDQIPEYERSKMTVKDFMQLTFFIEDEKSSIEWLRQKLLKKPQTYQDLLPDYMKELQHIQKYEKMPELMEILEESFLQYRQIDYDRKDLVPRQILSYLRQNYHNYRDLPDDAPEILKEAKGRWYVPDPAKSSDLEKIREKSLLKEFKAYIEEIEKSKKKLKQFRLEAIRCGFKDAWQRKDYKTIVDVGDRLPDNIIQEDSTLLMYYDNAAIKVKDQIV